MKIYKDQILREKKVHIANNSCFSKRYDWVSC